MILTKEERRGGEVSGDDRSGLIDSGIANPVEVLCEGAHSFIGTS